jgi:hypothetical protein
MPGHGTAATKLATTYNIRLVVTLSAFPTIIIITTDSNKSASAPIYHGQSQQPQQHDKHHQHEHQHQHAQQLPPGLSFQHSHVQLQCLSIPSAPDATCHLVSTAGGESATPAMNAYGSRICKKTSYPPKSELEGSKSPSSASSLSQIKNCTWPSTTDDSYDNADSHSAPIHSMLLLSQAT